jgi:hypothetical protein
MMREQVGPACLLTTVVVLLAAGPAVAAPTRNRGHGHGDPRHHGQLDRSEDRALDLAPAEPRRPARSASPQARLARGNSK